MKMRFRTDGWHYANLKARGMTWEEYGSCFTDEADRAEAKKSWDETPKAEPGDVWRIHWHHNEGEPEGPVAGYAICCPGCGHVHNWVTASNCNQKIKSSY